MRIDKTVVRAYLDGKFPADFRELWYFTSSTVASDQGKNIFEEPPCGADSRDAVRTVCEAIQRTAENFVPTNRPIWDALFPNWRPRLSEVTVDFIVGFPAPYDATVELGADKTRHVIFDVFQWTQYLGKCDLAETAQNLLTHELCHVLIGQTVPGADDELESADYLTQLDALTFHEAFAHLISFNAKEIGAVDWDAPRLAEVREKSDRRMRLALAETDPEQRAKNLYDAVCGAYYDKFACMSGMLYLARRWKQGGLPALQDELRAGPHGFAAKTAAAG